MAIAAVYTSGTANGSTAGASFTLTPPNSSAAAGNVAVIALAERTSSELVTKVADTAGGTLTFTKLRSGLQSTTASTSIWYRVLVTGDPGVGNTNTWTVTSTANAEGALMVYSGVDNTTPIDAQGTTTSTSSGLATFNAMTTVTNNAWFIGIFAGNYAVAALTTQSSGSTQVIRANASNGGATSSKQAVAIVDNALGSSGAQTQTQWNITSSNNWATDTFALRPVASSAPTVTTGAINEQLPTTAVANGNVTADGGASVTERGIVWSSSANPTTSDNKVVDGGSGTGAYADTITGLVKSTTYHYRAYAINSVGTSYGSDQTFTTASIIFNNYLFVTAGDGISVSEKIR